MAKFCGKCGGKLDEQTGLCPKCDAADEKQEKHPKKKRTGLMIAAILIAAIGILMAAAGAMVFSGLVDIPVISDLMRENERIAQSGAESDSQMFHHLTGEFTDIQVLDGKSAIQAAQDASSQLGLENAADDLSVKDIATSGENTFYRLQQKYEGIPVYGRTMVVIADKEGNPQGFTSNAMDLGNISFENPASQEQIESSVTQYLLDQKMITENTKVAVETASDENRIIYMYDDEPVPAYALQVYLNDSQFMNLRAIVHAVTGTVLNVEKTTYDIAATCYNEDKTIEVTGDLGDDKYQLADTTRKLQIFRIENTDSDSVDQEATEVFSENEIFGDTEEEKKQEQSKGVILLHNVEDIYDYYRSHFGETGCDWTYCFYNDAKNSGKDASGGFGTENDGSTYGSLKFGTQIGVESLDTIAHEYTHIISGKHVGWISIPAQTEKTDEPGAINEGISDVFGVIIEGSLKESEPDWEIEDSDRILSDPMKSGYPATISDKKYKKYSDKWAMKTENNKVTKATDYSHGFSTVISHCAYQMYTGMDGQYEKLSLSDLEKLWYDTMLTIPSNCTFSVLRDNMEMTAEILKLSDGKQQCVSAAFDAAGIVKTDASGETYAQNISLTILDHIGEVYTDYTIQITGKKKNNLRKTITTGAFTEDYDETITVTDDTPIELNLPVGTYTITVTDNQNPTLQKQKEISVKEKSKKNELILATWFGTEESSQNTNSTEEERSVILTLDVSASMYGTPIEETKNAAQKFVEAVSQENANTAIVTYSDDVKLISDFSSDKDSMINSVNQIKTVAGTNTEMGLQYSWQLLKTRRKGKKIIVLMSDGMPGPGKQGNDLISYADEIKESGVTIYTLGFFSEVDKREPQQLMEKIASPGCHYEVTSAEDLVFVFGDIADQMNGQKYIYIRIACPVDVSVTYQDTTLSSAEENQNLRTDFGTLTLEENEDASGDPIKVLRLKEGADYDVKITGTGRGLMDYTIGFMDENGEYSDFRRFENVEINKQTVIDTQAAVSSESILKIDSDGDGRYDQKLRAEANGYGEIIKDFSVLKILPFLAAILAVFAGVLAIFWKIRKKRRSVPNMTRYCGNCGTMLEENATVCSHCGMQVDKSEHAVSDSETAKPKKGKQIVKKIKLAVGVILLVCAVIAGISITSAFTGSNALLRKTMRAYKNYDIDTLVSLSSDVYYYDSGDYAEAYFKDQVGRGLDEFEMMAGRNYKFSYKVKEQYALSNRRKVELLDTLQKRCPDFDTSSIDKVVEADLTVTASHNDKSVDREVKVTMTREDGTWKVLYLE
jgi:Zn-dependent metalloprotease/uncharacterized protein YegL